MSVEDFLGIIAWGLIFFVVSILLFKWLGIVNSPPIVEVFLAAVFVELLRIESRLSKLDVKPGLVWSDFKKRKRV